jgi:hypothetical protein
MQIGLNTLNNIGLNYSVKLNDKEMLVYEKDERYSKKETSPNELSDAQKKALEKFEQRDAEVKAHELAHQTNSGGLAGAASYTYQQGPDGKMYAIGGSVPITFKSGSTPQESIKNAKAIASATTSPDAPSSRDFSLLSSAKMMQLKAEQQLLNGDKEKNIGLQAYANEAKEKTNLDSNTNIFA